MTSTAARSHGSAPAPRPDAVDPSAPRPMAGPRVDPAALAAPPDRLMADAAAWDAFVAAAPTAAYTQLDAWARVKAPNGWTASRVAASGESGPIGAQVLVRRLGPAPWSLGYAPRGPVAATFDRAGVAALTHALRDLARRERLTHLTADPEVEAGDPLEAWLREAGWTPGQRLQDTRSRIVELDRGEEALWSDLRSKWRQYVGKARRSGIVVTDEDASALPTFFRIYVETARRAGFVHRAERAYRDVFAAYAATDSARLLVARLPEGDPVAVLMLLSCGRRVIEPYGGMLAAAADTRANYLLKWEAIRSSAERGFGIYDMWGLATPGIERFKAGFGGREVRYVGAWELRTRPLLRHAIFAAAGLRERIGAIRQGAARRGASAGAAGDGDAT